MALVLRQSRQGSRGASAQGRGVAVQYGLQDDGSYTIPFGVEVVQKLVRWRRRAVGNLKKRRQAEARVLMDRDIPAAVELEEFWTGVNLAELQSFSLRELRIACASRDLDQIGTRAELIDRILQQQRRDLKRIARAEAFERLQRERLGEAKGAVYAFGQGYGPQVHSWDRCFVRNNLTVLQAMCGRGVVQVQVGFDSRVCLALCENGDVVSFGAVRPQDWAPLGYPDSKERRARGNKREEMHVAPTAAGDALDAGQARLAETQGGMRRQILPMEEDYDEDDTGHDQDDSGKLIEARVPFGHGAADSEADGSGKDSDSEQLPLRAQTAPVQGQRPSGPSNGRASDQKSTDRPGTVANHQIEGGRARRESLARLLDRSPPPRSAMTPAGKRRASLSAPTSMRRLTDTDHGDSTEQHGRRDSASLRPSSKDGLSAHGGDGRLRDPNQERGEGGDSQDLVGDDATTSNSSSKSGKPIHASDEASSSPNQNLRADEPLSIQRDETDIGRDVDIVRDETGDIGRDVDIVRDETGDIGRDVDIVRTSLPASNEIPSSLHADTGAVPRPRTQGSLPPGIIEEGAAGRRGRGSQGLPPVEKEMLATRNQLDQDQPDHPDFDVVNDMNGTGIQDYHGLQDGHDSTSELEKEVGWTATSAVSGVKDRVRGFSVSESRLAERERVASLGHQESSTAVSRKKRARQSLVEVLMSSTEDQDENGRSRGTGEGARAGQDGRRPSLGGPVGLEPLEPSEDDDMGHMAVGEVAVNKDKAESLPTQPHYNRYGHQGAGNLPAGAMNLPRRVPLRNPPMSPMGPGIDAAVNQASEMGDIARGKGLQPLNRSFAPPAGVDATEVAARHAVLNRPKPLPPGVDTIGWQRPPTTSSQHASMPGPMIAPGLQDRDNVVSTHGGAHSTSVAIVRARDLTRADDTAAHYVADSDPRTKDREDNKRRRRRESQQANQERRKASKRGRNARGARAKRASDAFKITTISAERAKAAPRATPVDIPWLTSDDRQRWQMAGGNAKGQDAIAARQDARAALPAEASPMSGTFSGGGSRSSKGIGSHGAQLLTRAKARSMLLVMGAGKSGKSGTLNPVPSTSLGRGLVAGPITSSLDRMALSGQPYPGAIKTGYAQAVTPRSALQHSLTLRGVATRAQEDEEAKTVGDTLQGHNSAVISLATRVGVGTAPPLTGAKLPPLRLPSNGNGNTPVPADDFVRDARGVPSGFEEDDSDPFAAARRDEAPDEKWWELSKGARDQGKMSAETGMQLAVKAFSNQRLGFNDASQRRFDATEWGGEQNYIDIERAVDADMRGYSDFAPPTEVRELRGECVVQLSASSQHAVAVTSGGDVFVFGAARQGVLGLGGDGRFHSFPFLMDTEEHLGLPANGRVVCAATGSGHSAVVTSQGELLVFGSSNFGRLGLGSVRNHGPRVNGTESQGRTGSRLPVAEGQSEAKGKGGALEGGYVSVPTPVPVFSLAAAVAAGGLATRMRVLQVSCGAAHTLALTDKGVYAWGAADGGRLGIGRHGSSQAAAMASRSKSEHSKHHSRPVADPSTLSSRVYDVPQEVRALRGQVVIQVEAAAWHSAAVVQVPPLVEGGWLYVWGSGGVGQLGLGTQTRAEEPELVTALLENNVVVAETSLGRYHSAVLSTDGEVWTWGSNAANCLGRPASVAAAGNPAFTPMPGRVEGVREYGVGSAVSVACGDRCTFVSTAPYAPETWPEWRERDMTLLDAARERRGAMLDRATGGAHDDTLRMAVDRAKEERQKLLELNRDRPLCVLAPPADGSVLGSHAKALGGMAVRKGKEQDRLAKEREDAENGEAGGVGAGAGAVGGRGSSKDAMSSSRSGASASTGGRRAQECIGFVARLFAPDKCDVCGHERRYHTLLRRVPPLEELVDRFIVDIEREEQLEFEYDAMRARRAASGATRAAQFARQAGKGS